MTEVNNNSDFIRYIPDKVNGENILAMLHKFIDGQTPRQAAIVVICAFDLQLLYPVSVPIIKQEFRTIGSVNWFRTLLRTMSGTDCTTKEHLLTKIHMQNYLRHIGVEEL